MQRKKSRKAKSGWRARVRRCNVIAGNRNGYNAVDTFAINPQGSKRLEPIICEVRNEQRTRRQVAISRNIRTEDSIDGLGESSGRNDRSLGIGLARSRQRARSLGQTTRQVSSIEVSAWWSSGCRVSRLNNSIREYLLRKVWRRRTVMGDPARRVEVRRQEDGAGEERRRRWKEVRPNMAAILCIPVVDGEASKQARPQRQLSMPVISRNAPQRSVLCIPDPRSALRREGLRAISLRTRGHDSARLDSAPLEPTYPQDETRRDETKSDVARRHCDVFATDHLPASLSPPFHSPSTSLFSSLVFLFAAILTLQGAT